jgi:hypothetical protein
MANPYETNQQIHSGTLNGVSGKWVPVESSAASASSLSNNPENPTLSADGAYYYAQDCTAYNYPSPVAANMNNAIPTPSQIVQLPPIVQPIAMVPYTTQNQPLVQYDPNYRPPVEHTAAPEPVYKPKPYAGISALIALLAVGVIVVACLLSVYNSYTAIGSLLWLFTESTAVDTLLTGDMSVIFTVIVPILYGVIMLFCLIIMINALVKLGKMKPLSKLNGWTLAAFLFAVADGVIMYVKKDIFTIGYGAYAIAAVLLVMLILPLFVDKKIQVLDYVASKQTYIIK